MVARSTKEWADFPARLNDALSRIAPEAQMCNERPVFILSAGWRSGSTLLQRMIMEHNNDILIWGEPFAYSDIWRSMANHFRCFTDDWPPKDWFLSARNAATLRDVWVANLYPEVAYLLYAHRQFFDVVFGRPARENGWKVWGMKEVRVTIDDARYLRVLYPKCKLLFLYRNPHDAYLSYRKIGAPWYMRWPDRPIASAFGFGRNWAGMTSGFIRGHKEVDGLLIRYEDLDDPRELKRIENYVGWPVPRSSQMSQVGKSRRIQMEHLPRVERMVLDCGVGRTFKDAGYN